MNSIVIREVWLTFVKCLLAGNELTKTVICRTMLVALVTGALAYLFFYVGLHMCQ